ncbi:hypothetical protein XENOCAPTIV_009168 [Xenoophorus captivus]|uniref:Serum amyloid A protein n=1 Tax=Xenoophorus captivus TaxID=1517983 RepID=A0ABV0R808_9TELE
MGKAYKDMRDANWINSDKYFHARGNYDAAQRGAGGRWAAEVISDAREWVQGNSGRGMRTQRVIRRQIVGDVAEEIPIITGQQDFLINTEKRLSCVIKVMIKF